MPTRKPILRRLPWRALLVLVSVVAAIYKWHLDYSKWQLDYSVCDSAYSGNLPALARSIQRGGDPNASWESGSAMDLAFWYKHREAGLYLLRHGADPNRLVPNVVYSIDPPTLKEFVAHGLRVRGPWGDRALFEAVWDGQAEMVEELLQRGADPNAREAKTNKSAWQIAHEPDRLACRDSPKILRLLKASMTHSATQNTKESHE